MKQTDFAYYLSKFLSVYLTGIEGLSENTILSYRDTFSLFLNFIAVEKEFDINKITLSDLTKELILDYLDWLEISRKCKPTTRNVRLFAIRSFFKFLQFEYPDRFIEWQRIIMIPKKKTISKVVEYLSIEEVKALLEQPDINNKRGMRDQVMLSLLYEGGLRVQELIDLEIDDIRIDNPSVIKVNGKGNKVRVIPISNNIKTRIQTYISIRQNDDCKNNVLFVSKHKTKFTRAGVNYLLKSYYSKMTETENFTYKKISCHSLRHSKAIHMLESGVNLVYIRDFLGHSSVQTTEIYARLNIETKKKIMEEYSKVEIEKQDALWHKKDGLLDWLKNLGS